jgi:hypothetical protein
MRCCNLLNYVIILLKEKKRKEKKLETKHTHTTHIHARLLPSFMALLLAAATRLCNCIHALRTPMRGRCSCSPPPCCFAALCMHTAGLIV